MQASLSFEQIAATFKAGKRRFSSCPMTKAFWMRCARTSSTWTTRSFTTTEGTTVSLTQTLLQFNPGAPDLPVPLGFKVTDMEGWDVNSDSFEFSAASV